MSNVIFYGDHPLSTTANAFFNRTIIDSIQHEHEVACFTFNNINQMNVFQFKNKYNTIPIGMDFAKDAFGMQEIARRLQEVPFDIFVSNNDIWRLFYVAQQYGNIHRLTGFKWIQYFPCDCNEPRQDWLQIMLNIDVPLVYSKHGYNMYSAMVPKLQYLKPIVEDGFVPFTSAKREEARRGVFGDEKKDDFIVAIIGKNQIRKDIIRGMEIFRVFANKHKGVRMYLHMEAQDPMWGSDLLAVAQQMGISNLVTFKTPGLHFTKENLCSLYNSIDALLIPSVAEGLCLPILEAQLCRVPVIAADNSAITELVEGDKGFLINRSKEMLPIPIMAYGQRVTDPRPRCDTNDGAEKLEYVYLNKGKIDSVINKAQANARTYLEPTKFKKVFDYVEDGIERKRRVKPARKNKVLFIQYLSAGDVLMTTGLLKAIKEKEKMDIDYMVGPQYKDMLINNPDISEIIDWDFNLVSQYAKWFHPHKIIISGNWNSQDLSLYDIYARLCDVPYGKMFIDCAEPSEEIRSILQSTEYVTVSSSGGHQFRTYPFFSEVIKKVNDIPFVQIGGPNDLPIPGAFNLCGKLSFRESAWVINNGLLHIGVDTFQAHLAAALDKMQIVLYSTGPRRVIRPRGFAIDIEPDYVQVCPILGPCGGMKSDCDARCIRSLNPFIIADCVNIMREEIKRGEDLKIMVDTIGRRCGELWQ